jgi:glycosyltransferase involved in cell wall biosynthesis
LLDLLRNPLPPKGIVPAKGMKLLVFAHVPPPLHGQSQMVQYLVDGLADPRHGIQIHHVDARLSTNLTDVGSTRGGKLPRLVRYWMQAILGRLRSGAATWYLLPSPPKRSSLYRDWIVMLLVRPWFRRTIFHWHAVGLGEWLETHARPWERWLTHQLMDRPDVAIVLSAFNQPDAERFRPRSVAIVPNGIPDPCPGYDDTLAKARDHRWAGLRGSGGVARALFLANCTPDKGVFDALEAIALANTSAPSLDPAIEWELVVAGGFVQPADEAAFHQRIARPDLAGRVRRVGFVSGASKARAFAEADVFLYPSYFANEGQPLALIEAMAHGLVPVSTRWRGIPEMLPASYPGLVPVRDPAAAARALGIVARTQDHRVMRARYLGHYSLEAHLSAMSRALRGNLA